MRNIYNDRIDSAKIRMNSNNNFNLSDKFIVNETPNYFMFSSKYGYMENGALPMSNFSNDQDFARMGKNGLSGIVGA